MAIEKKLRVLSGKTQVCYLVWMAWEFNWEHLSNQVMEFLPCVQLTHDLHSVSVGLVVRVHYVCTCPLEFQQGLEAAQKVFDPGDYEEDVPIRPIIDPSAFFDILLMLIICSIWVDHTMNLCSGRVTVSVLKMKCHPRIIFVSDNPPSADNLFFAINGLKGIGSFLSFCQASTSIASGIAAFSQSVFLVPGRSTVNPDVNICVSLVVDGDVHD
jgi:hypothetical protein